MQHTSDRIFRSADNFGGTTGSGAVIGIIVGGIVIAGAAVTVILCKKKKKRGYVIPIEEIDEEDLDAYYALKKK